MLEKVNIPIENLDYLTSDLNSCKLCEWQCKVDRLSGEVGVCGITLPEVSSSQLHPAPPASFDAFLTGCSFRCLSCQNWPVANYPANTYYEIIEGYYEPHAWAEMAVAALSTAEAKLMGADRLFFTGGEPTCSLPWVEAVVAAVKKIEERVKVNFDTNGFMTLPSLMRILEISDSVTFDIKAFEPNMFKALTGAEVEPVLRNAEYIARNTPDSLWEFRILVIPNIHDYDLKGLCEFIADINSDLPVNLLAFRPNFVMNDHSWTGRKFMEDCVSTARRAGLENVSWSGRTKNDIIGYGSETKIPLNVRKTANSMDLPKNAALAMGYAKVNGCVAKSLRHCGSCTAVNDCKIKRFSTNKLQ